jgi:hypothetical protein
VKQCFHRYKYTTILLRYKHENTDNFKKLRYGYFNWKIEFCFCWNKCVSWSCELKTIYILERSSILQFSITKKGNKMESIFQLLRKEIKWSQFLLIWHMYWNLFVCKVNLTSFEKETFSKAVAEGIQLLKQMIIQVSELFWNKWS